MHTALAAPNLGTSMQWAAALLTPNTEQSLQTQLLINCLMLGQLQVFPAQGAVLTAASWRMVLLPTNVCCELQLQVQSQVGVVPGAVCAY
jgi:hypothetical protein